MIKTLDEFAEADKFIQKDLEMYDFDLSKQMNSYEYNLYLQDTQYYFEMLYEKIRVLEDMINYLDRYSEAKIFKVRGLLKRKESILQTAVDQYTDKNFILVSPEWISNPIKKILDRDGSKMSTASTTERKDNYISNQTVRPGYSVAGRAIILNAIRIGNSIPVSDTLKDFPSTGSYSVTYECEKPSSIQETIAVTFDNSGNELNGIEYNAINCDVDISSSDEIGKLLINLKSNYGRKIKIPFDYDGYTGRQTDNAIKLLEKIEGKDIVEAENKIIDSDNKKVKKSYLENVAQKQIASVELEIDESEVEETKNCWKYVPKTKKEKRLEVEKTPFNIKSPVSHLENNNSSPDAYNYKALYKMGINNFSICQKIFYKTSGIISEPIDLDNYSYITLSTKNVLSPETSVEYSILDGTTIVPVLPENDNIAYQEKLFSNMPTRFPVDRRQKIILYEDGVVTDKNYTNLSPEDFEKHEYRLSYTPGKECHKYKPKNNNIRIMIVFRQGQETQEKGDVLVYVRKYGGALEWN